MDRPFPLTGSAAAALGISVTKVRAIARENGFEKVGCVVIRESDPTRFLETFFAAMEQGCAIWLASPDWGEERLRETAEMANETECEPGAILIPTGGTTGRLRFAAHTWETLSASARGFGEFFGETCGHKTLCVLPLYHVSGLMQAVRVATFGGRLVVGNAHDPRAGLPPDFSPEGFFISLVPTQLRRLLDDGAAAWLGRFKTILVGGASLDTALAARAFEARLPLSPSYGMTETAAAICALKPSEFLAGASGVGRPLPHVSVTLDADSRVRIRAKSLCAVMIPAKGADFSNGLLTNDIGEMGADGVLHIKGRADRVIVSGGQKIDAGEVEEALLETGLLTDAFVLGMSDPLWGEKVAALYAGKQASQGLEESLKNAVRRKLSPIHVPKKWVRVDAIPRNAAGKPDVAAIRAVASETGD
jgi:o-succinylbenzoate---CoA ligase